MRSPDVSHLCAVAFFPAIMNLPIVPINSYVTVSQEKVMYFPFMHKIIPKLALSASF